MMIGNKTFTAHKDKKKKIRVVFQLIVLSILVYVIVTALVIFKTYQPYQEQKNIVMGDQGFIALSYFGVAKKGTSTLIGEADLKEQLTALKKQGYVTVTQQDIFEYYTAGKELPKKSLFLAFEDGRRDTSVFAEQILEELNFKATCLTYPEKFIEKDTKFLMPKQLKDLEQTSYWEMGTNGYRLAFINVFDRYNNYLGELTPLEHKMVAPFLERNYNHYLMDYIRDADGVPKESYNRMKQRISYNYEKLRDIYIDELGSVPALYILMHSNTGSFGNNDKVSAINAYWIKNLFKMNFNREGDSFNQKNSSIYDLTRLQPQSYWATNHLLMKIKYDTNQAVNFVKGNMEKQEEWETLQGASEFKDEDILLTSLPQKSGWMKLKKSDGFKDMNLSVRLKGNKLGIQRVYVRADDQRTRYLYIGIENNTLIVTERVNGTERNLFWLDLDKLDGIQDVSLPENKKMAEMKELETFSRYASSVKTETVYLNRLNEKATEEVPSVESGAAVYIPVINTNAAGDRLVDLSLKDNQLTIHIDGKAAVRNLQTADVEQGSIYLEAAWSGYGWSQRNLTDDIYDGVFEKIMIKENTGSDKDGILFDGGLKGIVAAEFWAKNKWSQIVTWFVTYL